MALMRTGDTRIVLSNGLENPQVFSYEGVILTPFDFTNDFLYDEQSWLPAEKQEKYGFGSNQTPMDRIALYVYHARSNSAILDSRQFMEMVIEAWRRYDENGFDGLRKELTAEPADREKTELGGPYNHLIGTVLRFEEKIRNGYNAGKFRTTRLGYRDGKLVEVGEDIVAPEGNVRELSENGLPFKTTKEAGPLENPSVEGFYSSWNTGEPVIGEHRLLKCQVFYQSHCNKIWMNGSVPNRSPYNSMASDSVFIATGQDARQQIANRARVRKLEEEMAMFESFMDNVMAAQPGQETLLVV